MIRYSGIKRDGTHTTGQADEAPGEFVEAKYRARWQELSVTDPGTGEVIGEIHDLTDDGRRIWWAMDAEGDQ